jgi:tRNA dimethylallyltransferase
LYLKALHFGLFDGPPADETLRQRLEEEATLQGRAALHQRLADVDPDAAARLHPNDLRRVIRALEVWELTGRPLSRWQTQWTETRPRAEANAAPVYCLDVPRAELYARINARVRWMFAEGLVEEVQALRRQGQPISPAAAQALGYKEVFAYLDGQATLDETLERVQTRTRQFAKRQLTWFRHLPGCRPVTRELTFTRCGLTMKKG